VDLRERRPYRFHGAITKALSTGDYSILGLENCIALERKSLPDLLSVIGQSRRRFERELNRLAQIQYAAIVVEGNFADLFANKRSKLHLKTVFGTLVAWSWHHGIPIWFACNRALAEQLTLKLLIKAAKYAANNPGETTTMADNRDELRGVLFRNDKKTEGDKKPNYRGQITIGGVEYRLSAWISKSRKGMSYMSLAATPPEKTKPVANGEDLDADFQVDEDIPFVINRDISPNRRFRI
jgi:ERCC4-type nuclease